MSRHIEIQDSASNKFILSKTIIGSEDLLKRDIIKELFDYVNKDDVELNKVKAIIKKANMKLRIDGIHLFIRKSSDKEVENIICMTRR